MCAPQADSLRAGLGQHFPGPEEAAAECGFTVTAWCLSPQTAARRARQLLRAHLAGHISDQSVLDDVEIMVCELATNASVHAGGPCEMRILHHGDVPVVCEIADTGGGLDVIAEHFRRHTGTTDAEDVIEDVVEGAADVDVLQVGGRGLGIVALLSGGRCGVHTTRLYGTGQVGKCVWFACTMT